MDKKLIHPTALIEDTVKLADNVKVGPYVVIRGNVTVGAGTTVDAHAVIEGRTTLGENNVIGIGAVIGNPPQDLKYNGEDTEVVIGDNNTIREYVTVNRGTTDRGRTEIGNGCLLMAYVHVAHDCLIGNDVILANCSTLAGHLTIEDYAIIGGVTPVHQFVRIGRYSIVGGGSRVPKDIPPYCKAAGNPLKIYGLNSIGMERRGFSAEERKKLKKAYRIIFNSGLNTAQALERVEADQEIRSPHVDHLIEFIKSSQRGICKN